MEWIEQTFPQLTSEAYQITSSPTLRYNCIGWAAGDDRRWWQHLPGYYWPAKRAPMVESLVSVFESLGYERCEDGTLEAGYDRVAIYARNGMWKHAARQLPDGRWTSKLGEHQDICHDTPEDLCGTFYGEVHCFMRRPRDGREAT